MVIANYTISSTEGELTVQYQNRDVTDSTYLKNFSILGTDSIGPLEAERTLVNTVSNLSTPGMTRDSMSFMDMVEGDFWGIVTGGNHYLVTIFQGEQLT